MLSPKYVSRLHTSLHPYSPYLGLNGWYFPPKLLEQCISMSPVLPTPNHSPQCCQCLAKGVNWLASLTGIKRDNCPPILLKAKLGNSGSQSVAILLPTLRGHWECLEGRVLAETWNMDKYPIMHRIAPSPTPNNEIPGPKFKRAEIGKPKRHRGLCVAFLSSCDFLPSTPSPWPNLNEPAKLHLFPKIL